MKTMLRLVVIAFIYMLLVKTDVVSFHLKALRAPRDKSREMFVQGRHRQRLGVSSQTAFEKIGVHTEVLKPRRSWSKQGGLQQSAPFSEKVGWIGKVSEIGNENELPRREQDRLFIRHDSLLPLQNPQVVLFYRILKEKSLLRRDLDGQQASFAAQSDNGPQHTLSKGAGTILPSLLAANKERYETYDNNKGGMKRRRSDIIEQQEGDEDEEDEHSDDLLLYDVEDSDAAELIDSFGSADLSALPSGVLSEVSVRSNGDFTVMPEMLLVEYGVIATEDAIQRAVEYENRLAFRARKRSGKTRRDRSNVRTLRQRTGVMERRAGVAFPASGNILLTEVAEKLQLSPAVIVSYLVVNEGMLVNVGQAVDVEVARRVAAAFGKKTAPRVASSLVSTPAVPTEGKVGVKSAVVTATVSEDKDGVHIHSSLAPRPAVVTIMGHVDHGKTTLLDRLRSAHVAASEKGGITQAISAFSVPIVHTGKGNTGQDNITFIDTPGHAAFSAMRVRGARVTDIVVLVVAADDGVMEQTRECIAAAKLAGCPLVVAINKMDKEGADPSIAVAGLLEEGVLLEEFGGETQCAHISAKTGTGLDDLLDKISLQAEIMDLRARVSGAAVGTVLEVRKDKGLGLVLTALVQEGTLRVGDLVLAGQAFGRVRRLLSDKGAALRAAYPSMPVQIVGLSGSSTAGDTLASASSEVEAKSVVEARERIVRQEIGSANLDALKARVAVGTADMMRRTDGQPKNELKIPLIVKCDVAGSAEAVRNALEDLQQSDDSAVCMVDIVTCGLGDVTASDVASAAAFKANIVAFNVGCISGAQASARSCNVDIHSFSVIYELLEDVAKRISAQLQPPLPGILSGRLLVKRIFKIGKANKIAGCELWEGRVDLMTQVRVLRTAREVVYTGSLTSIRVGKDIVSEVSTPGNECGIAFSDFSDMAEGDVIECFLANSATM